MSVNLLDLAKSAVAGQVMKSIGGILGANESQATSAVGAALPAILGGLIKKASTPQGADDLSRVLDQQDDSILDNIGDILGGGNHQGMVDQGTGLLGSIFGGGTSGIFDLVAKATGLGGGKMGSLFGVLAPIVMSLLSRQKKSNGWDSGGLANFLAGQKDHIAPSMPAGMGDVLGLSGLGGSSAASSRPAPTHSTTGGSGGGGLLGKLLPLLILAGIAIFAIKFLMGGGTADDGTVDDGGVNVTLPGDVGGVDLGGVDLSGIGGEMGGKLTSIFGDTQKLLGGITDVAGAQEAATKLGGLTTQIGELGAIPEAAKGAVGQSVNGFITKLPELAKNAMGIEGVGDILKPVLDKLIEALKAFIG